MSGHNPPVFRTIRVGTSSLVPLIQKVKWLTGKVKVRFLLNFAIEGITHEFLREEGPVRTISTPQWWPLSQLHSISLLPGAMTDCASSRRLRMALKMSGARNLFCNGRLFNLGPIRLIKLAAFFGALKLAVACICDVHIVDRFRCMMRGQPNSKILEAGLILVVAISVAAVGPAFSTHTSALMREHTMQLLIAAFAIGLCMFERARMIGEQKTEITENITVDKTTTQAAPRYHV